LIGCISNPIFINTGVVFVRLYWFEKRFNSIVVDAQNSRRTKDGTRSKSEVKLEQDIDYEEKGMGQRSIIAERPEDETIHGAEKIGSNRSSDNSPNTTSSDTEERNSGKQENSIDKTLGFTQSFRRGSTSGEEIRRPARQDPDIERMPTQRTAETHIAFLENQRNPKDRDVLYIPGPREFDRGDVPQHIEDDGDPLNLTFPRNSETSLDNGHESEDGALDRNNNNTKTHISFGDSVPAISRASHGAMSDIKDRSRNEAQSTREKQTTAKQGGNGDNEDSPMNLRKRSRTKTFASLMSQGSQDEIDPMPYLSYQPTIGRNSAFVNLTQEQREELGGIEYRALRTLAVVLCCKSLVM